MKYAALLLLLCPFIGLAQSVTIGNGVTIGTGVTAGLTSTPPPPSGIVFTPAAGSYTGTQNVAITQTYGAGNKLFWTDDGSAPSEASTLYASPIAISSNTTFKALAESVGTVRQETQALPVNNTSAGWKLCTPLPSNSNGTPTSGNSSQCGGGVGSDQPSTWNVTTGTQESISVSGTSGAPQILITLGGSGCDSCTKATMDRWVKPLNSNDLANVENHEMDLWHNDGTRNRLHMGGLQCNQQSAFLQWQIDNEQGSWQNTGITDACPLSTSLWTHVVFRMHWIIGDTGCGGLGCTYYDSLELCQSTSPLVGCALNHHAINRTLESFNPGWGAGCADQDQVDLRSGVHTGGILIQHNNVTCSFGTQGTSSANYTF